MLVISIANRFRKEIDLSRLESFAREVCKTCGLEGEQKVYLRISTDKVIAKYNKAYLGNPEPTDVLSFENAYQDPEDGAYVLGDILISIERAAVQAEAGKHSLQEELEMLLVHGLLHLCGYDHADPMGLREMAKRQDQILKSMGNPVLKSIHVQQ